MLVMANVALYIKFVVVSFSEQCEKQKATLPSQVSGRKEEEGNVSTPSEGEKSTEKGECMYPMPLHVYL